MLKASIFTRGKGVAVYIRDKWYKLLVGEPVCNVVEFAWCMRLDFKSLDTTRLLQGSKK